MDFATKEFLFGFLNTLSAYLRRIPKTEYELAADIAAEKPCAHEADLPKEAKPATGALVLVFSKMIAQQPNVELLSKMLSAISLKNGDNAALVDAQNVKSAEDFEKIVREARPQSILFMDGRVLWLARKEMPVRGKIFDFHGVPAMFTFDTTLLLLEPAKKRRAWEDLQAFRDVLRGISADYAARFAGGK